MIIAKLSDQLGNQMFAYAAVKTIALDKCLPFAFFIDKKEGDVLNDSDPKYGNRVDTIFKSLEEEVIIDIPSYSNFYQEIVSTFSSSAFCSEALNVQDNTIMAGHYISPLYFIHRIDKVREWFAFPFTITNKIDNKINIIREQNKNRVLVSVHFRNAEDYRNGGFMLKSRYWWDAAIKTESLFFNPLFIIFYDEKTELVTRFIKHFKGVEMRGTLVEDMYAITQCDHHIICNSSFSIMSALLDSKPMNMVIRPSKFPVPGGYIPTDIYFCDWMSIRGEKDWYSEVRRIKKISKFLLKKNKEFLNYISANFLKYIKF